MEIPTIKTQLTVGPKSFHNHMYDSFVKAVWQLIIKKNIKDLLHQQDYWIADTPFNYHRQLTV